MAGEIVDGVIAQQRGNLGEIVRALPDHALGRVPCRLGSTRHLVTRHDLFLDPLGAGNGVVVVLRLLAKVMAMVTATSRNRSNMKSWPTR